MCNAFHYDTYGTICRHAKLNQRLYKFTNELYIIWVHYSVLWVIKVKIHKITPATGKERGDIEIKDYVVLQNPQGQDNRLPPRTFIMDFTMTHVRFGRSHLHPLVNSRGHHIGCGLHQWNYGRWCQLCPTPDGYHRGPDQSPAFGECT